MKHYMNKLIVKLSHQKKSWIKLINISKLDQKPKIRSMNQKFFHGLTDQKPEQQNKGYIQMSKF